MLFHFDYNGSALIYVPDSSVWELNVVMLDPMHCELRLSYGTRMAVLADTATWKRGRPRLPANEIAALYSDVISAVSTHLALHPEAHSVDISEFETKLVTELYYPRWRDLGFIFPDADGNW